MCEVTRRLLALLRLLETDTRSSVAEDDVLLDAKFGHASAEFPMERY
ncbi:hypothetical protein GCM10009745_13720 [Kribbella yunnanensis]|uniref:Uncharacterized protein n=1 Tax=Kribbella yunnanensis TaxID=190194 RepID=A0ABN2GJ77_9ACTN